MSFQSACALIEASLAGPARGDIAAAAASEVRHARDAWAALGDQMRSHRWRAGGRGGAAERLAGLDTLVADLDRRTRAEGLHVLHDWDGKADHVNPDPIVVDVARHLGEQSGTEPPDARAIAIVLDYYFLYLLALLAVRAWDDDDADANLDRVASLVQHLQGAEGGGVRLIDEPMTLLLVAGSHFEMADAAYDRLLSRVRALDIRHRLPIARTHASSLGSHLRFGIEATYGRDVGAMRDDNVVDYTWLGFSLATLMRAHDDAGQAGHHANVANHDGDAALVEAIANGLSADAPAFLAARAPAAVGHCAADRADFRDRFLAGIDTMREAFAPHRPVDGTYCPLALFFNFSQNVLKGIVIDAALWTEPRGVTLDGLLTAAPVDDARQRAKLRLADTLMGFARARPDRIRGRLTPVIVYDVVAGRRAFGAMARAMAP